MSDIEPDLEEKSPADEDVTMESVANTPRDMDVSESDSYAKDAAKEMANGGENEEEEEEPVIDFHSSMSYWKQVMAEKNTGDGPVVLPRPVKKPPPPPMCDEGPEEDTTQVSAKKGPPPAVPPKPARKPSLPDPSPPPPRTPPPDSQMNITVEETASETKLPVSPRSEGPKSPTPPAVKPKPKKDATPVSNGQDVASPCRTPQLNADTDMSSIPGLQDIPDGTPGWKKALIKKKKVPTATLR